MQTGKRSRPGKVVSSNYGLPVKISNVAINRLERVRVSFGSIDRRSNEGKGVRESTRTIVNERPRLIKAAAAIFRHGESPRAGAPRESAPRLVPPGRRCTVARRIKSQLFLSPQIPLALRKLPTDSGDAAMASRERRRSRQPPCRHANQNRVSDLNESWRATARAPRKTAALHSCAEGLQTVSKLIPTADSKTTHHAARRNSPILRLPRRDFKDGNCLTAFPVCC